MATKATRMVEDASMVPCKAMSVVGEAAEVEIYCGPVVVRIKLLMRFARLRARLMMGMVAMWRGLPCHPLRRVGLRGGITRRR